MTARDDAAMQALSDAGAQCGNCGDEPGDRTCPDCERCYQWYVAALRKAGWAPRAEVLAEAANKQRKFVLSDEFVCDDWEAALQVIDLIDPAAAAPAPVESAGDETAEAPHAAPCRYPASPYCTCTDGGQS